MKTNKWVILGYIAAIFNPIPTGIIAGYFLYTEKKYKNHGAIVMIVSVFLFALLITLSLFPPPLV